MGGRGLCWGHFGLWGASLEQEPRPTWLPQAPCPATSSSLSAHCPHQGGASWGPRPVRPVLSHCDVQGPFPVMCRRRLAGALPSAAFVPDGFFPQPMSFLCFPVFLRSQWALEVDQKPHQGLFLGPPLPSQGLHFAFEVPRGDPFGRLSSLQPLASSPPRGLGRAGLQGRLLTSVPSPPGACGVWSESSALWAVTVPLLPCPRISVQRESWEGAGRHQRLLRCVRRPGPLP